MVEKKAWKNISKKKEREIIFLLITEKDENEEQNVNLHFFIFENKSIKWMMIIDNLVVCFIIILK